MTINNKIVVCYLFSKFDDLSDIFEFIKNYKSFNSGYNHSLLICLKLINEIKKKTIIEILNKNKVNCELFIDLSTNNDFDFGSYYRVSQKFNNHLIFYLNASSKPIVDNWLKLIVNQYESNSLVGTTGSFESHLSSIKLKKFYKIFSYIFKKVYYSLFFKNFPNPHIRTTGFLINSNDYIEFYKGKIIKNKFDAWKIESGRFSLTNYFLKKNFPVKLINSEGNAFTIKNWSNSNTFCYTENSRLIISDKHTRKYDVLDEKDKLISQINVWGK